MSEGKHDGAIVAVGLVVVWLGGCAGPPALERSVLGYDETTAALEHKLLLLNIARWDAGLPVHFTTTSSIAATFDWSTVTGIGGQLEGGGGADFLNLNLGASGSENPTFSITPITGETFTQRILRPLRDEIFNSLIFQGDRLDLMMRLMSNGIEIQNPDGSYVRFINNDPKHPGEYEEFRRVVLHLNWLFANDGLFVRTLVFEDVLINDFEPTGYDIDTGLTSGLTWRQKPDGRYTLSRLDAGRVVVTNFDPLAMSHRERWVLNEKIKLNPPSFVYLEIRSDGPGGEMPIQGAISLRSIVRILDFVAQGIQRHPEFHVEKDPRTGDIPASPAATLKILVTEGAPASGITSIRYGDKYYSVADTPWDRTAFRLLTWLFQAALGDVQSVGIPITISK